MNRIYVAFCVFISVFIMVAKLVYSGNYSKLDNVFEPVNVSIVAKDCSLYGLLADSGNIDLLYTQSNDAIGFYPYSAPKESICNMNRNVIEVGIKNLILRSHLESALKDIQSINIAIGSRNFHLHKDDISITSDSSESYFIDLSHFRLNNDSEFMNNANSLWFDIFIMLISPPYSLIWIVVLIFLLPVNITNFKAFIANHYIFVMCAIVALGFALRLHNFTLLSLWGDELYSVGVVGYPYDSVLSVFSDPGNPPFYNLILNQWLRLFGYSAESARLLSVIIGSMAPISIFIFMKNHTNNIFASLLGALFMSISQVAIGSSHEVRGYVLELVLIPLVCNYLFNFYKTYKIRDLAFYVLFAIMLCNTHYFGAIFVFTSFVVSIFMLLKARQIFMLFIADVVIALSLLPYFYITAFNKSLMDTSFNTWIKMPGLNDIFILPFQMLGSDISVVLFFIFLLCSLLHRSRILYFIFGVCILMVAIPYMASYVRPIYITKYVIFVIYPLVIVFISWIIFTLKVPYRVLFIPLCAYIFSISLFDSNVSPIGRGDNSRAKFEFITQDSMHYDNAYILDLNNYMALKERQYEVYGLQPNVSFVKNIDGIKSGVFYFDNYYTESSEVIKELQEKGALVYKIPFGRNNSEKLQERNDFIYKVIL